MPRFGRYVTTGHEFEGGTGTVYICDDPALDRRVAIKFLGPHRDKRRIQNEINALQAVRSKNVVELLDIVIEPGNNIGVVEEFLDGDSLSDVEPTTTDELLRLVYQMASGVADIHAARMIHRDLKPSNMRLTSSGILKILDFDLSRVDVEAGTFGFKGTHGFAAPELYATNPSFNTAVDVYALAATVGAITNNNNSPVVVEPGRLPSTAAFFAAGGFGAITPTLPPELVLLLNSALSDQPSHRPTAAAIRDAAARELLVDRHRAFVTYGGTGYYCDATNRRLTVQVGTNSIDVEYTGRVFRVTRVGGNVQVNGVAAVVGLILTGCSVLSLGVAGSPAYEREFMTLDVSHPEVVL